VLQLECLLESDNMLQILEVFLLYLKHIFEISETEVTSDQWSTATCLSRLCLFTVLLLMWLHKIL